MYGAYESHNADADKHYYSILYMVKHSCIEEALRGIWCKEKTLRGGGASVKGKINLQRV